MNDSQFLEEHIAQHNANLLSKYVFFWGHQVPKSGVSASCFSQWYPAPMTIDGINYPTAEHFMMAEKARLFGDAEIEKSILASTKAPEVKALGRQIKGFNEDRWIEHRFDIVCKGNLAKFSQNHELGEFLKNTGNKVIVEASPVDRIWGIGLAQDDDKAQNPNLWNGLNLLGFALMQVRENLQNNHQTRNTP